MSHILVVYGTNYGHTERIVQRMAQRWSERGIRVSAHRVKAGDPGPGLDDCDACLVAASVIKGRHQQGVADFVLRHAGELAALPSTFVSVSGAAANPDPAHRADAVRLAEDFVNRAGWHPQRLVTIGGAIAYTRYGFLLRRIMRWMARRQGSPWTDITRDYDLTDWGAVDRLADEIAGVVGALPVPTGHPGSCCVAGGEAPDYP